MIPLVGEVKELKYVKDIVVRTANEVMEEKGVNIRIYSWYNDRNTKSST